MEATVARAESDDSPNRCQAVTSRGQCDNLVAPHSNFCIVHGGNKAGERVALLELRNYRLTKYHARAHQMAESSDVKSLRDEIGILRMMLEERLNSIKSPMDVMIQSQPVSELIGKIEKVVLSCHKLEERTGQVLDKQALLQFASEVITVVSDTLGDSPDVEKIADGILAVAERNEDV